MKIVTWNVNGIRSMKKTIPCVLEELESDVTCFQETKITRSMLPETIALIDGYTSYFSYPRKQSGYSGVASYCTDRYVPQDAEEGLSGVLDGRNENHPSEFLTDFEESSFTFMDLDSEGRIIITYHLIKFDDEIRKLAVINVYCPRVDCEKPERHLYKMQFCRLLEAKALDLCQKNCFVVIVGDMNISYSVLDHCEPGDENEFNSHEARQWLRLFLSTTNGLDDDIGFVDAFRHFYPDKKEAYTCWSLRTGARSTNYGVRIDYILISSQLVPLLLSCEILSDYHGSDHCPVRAEFRCDPVSVDKLKLPSICTRLWPEFSGKQQKLQFFLQKGQSSSSDIKTQSSQPSTINKNNQKKKNNQKSIYSFFKKDTPSSNNNSETRVTEAKIENNEEYNHSSEVKNAISNDHDITEPPSKTLRLDDLESEETSSQKSSQASEWKSVLRGPPKPPMCTGHKKPSVLRTVKKKGPNYGRQFFMCAQPPGHSSNPDASCNFFKWASAAKVNVLKSS
ncbi:DNA-(apurinic or apyrimidinic site) endonuclease 2-like [Uloborus diversus]|uniref:DNA-(apurinic or apyrimidinic site) endonuclease 2-like n=1 Tax=Uloborus diversus TaxID=327109 RepID=UPI0024093EFF|nr:DNA-(apurinic or apyrimidinic site) endonuclease 2-like [Uloborus diversus]